MSQEATKLTQAELAKQFVQQVKEYEKHVETRMKDDDEALKFYIQETGSVTRGLDCFMYANPQFRAAYNKLCAREGEVENQIGYDTTAIEANDEKYISQTRSYEGRSLDTASNPGGANLIQTSLSDTIIHKAEKTGQVLALLGKDSVPYGDTEYPRISAKAVGQFIDENTTDWTDIVPTTYEAATIGITKVKFTPRDYGIHALYTQRLLKKVTPAAIKFFRDYESKGIARGLEQQSLRGNGSAPNAQGILGIATAVPFSGDAYETFNNAVGILGAADTDNIVAVMSRKTWTRYKMLRATNSAYRDIIDPVKMQIDDISIILSNNVNASEATAGNVILGDYSHYMMLTCGGLETLEDPYVLASKRTKRVFHTMQVDLGALIPASFATFVVTY